MLTDYNAALLFKMLSTDDNIGFCKELGTDRYARAFIVSEDELIKRMLAFAEFMTGIMTSFEWHVNFGNPINLSFSEPLIHHALF